VERMHRKLRTKAGKAIYAARKCVVEPVFGQINVAAAINHQHLLAKLREGSWSIHQPDRTSMVLAVALAGAGLVVAVYLLVFR
jgi:hypothetical protein